MLVFAYATILSPNISGSQNTASSCHVARVEKCKRGGGSPAQQELMVKDLYDLLPEGADPKLVTELRTMRVMSSRGPGWTKVAHLLGSSEEVFEALKAWHPKHEMLCLQPLARMVRTKPDFVQCGCTRRHKGRKLNQKLNQDDVEAGNTSTGRNNRQRGRLNAVSETDLRKLESCWTRKMSWHKNRRSCRRSLATGIV